jgi:hypothetical protein
MAADDLASFARRIRIQANRVQDGADEATIACASAVATELVESTPVDTGRAISNWDASLGPKVAVYRPAAVPGEKGSTRSGSVAEALGRMLRAITAYKSGTSGGSINITNAAPYIERLNAGSSSQAPAGFIESAIQRGRAAIRNVRIFK